MNKGKYLAIFGVLGFALLFAFVPEVQASGEWYWLPDRNMSDLRQYESREHDLPYPEYANNIGPQEQYDYGDEQDDYQDDWIH